MKKRNDIQNETDQQLYKTDKTDNIITFNGQGRSGKSTHAKRFVKTKSGSNLKIYTYVLAYALRDHFKKDFYEKHLQRKDVYIKTSNDNCPKLMNVEVLGLPSLPWLATYFHWKVKPLLLDNSIIVFDHYLGDYYAEMLPDGDAEKFQSFVKNSLGIPHFENGIHYSLDINYCTYQEREKNRKGTEWSTVDSEALFEDRRARYQELCNLGYLTCIDATVSEGEVFEQIQASLPQYLS